MNAEPTSQKPLRLWSGIVAAALLLLFKFVVVPIVSFGSPPIPVLGGLVFLLLRNGEEMAAFRLSPAAAGQAAKVSGR